jgi:hypothetical protein
MKYSNWIGILSVIVLIYASFQPWVFIDSQNLTLTGMNTAGTTFGKPALVNLVLSAVAAMLFLLPYVFAKRANLFFCALNLAWAIRNFILLSICHAGECAEKKTGIYIYVAAAIMIMLMGLFPDVKLKDEEND